MELLTPPWLVVWVVLAIVSFAVQWVLAGIVQPRATFWPLLPTSLLISPAGALVPLFLGGPWYAVPVAGLVSFVGAVLTDEELVESWEGAPGWLLELVYALGPPDRWKFPDRGRDRGERTAPAPDLALADLAAVMERALHAKQVSLEAGETRPSPPLESRPPSRLERLIEVRTEWEAQQARLRADAITEGDPVWQNEHQKFMKRKARILRSASEL